MTISSQACKKKHRSNVNLEVKMQILPCLKWLGELQVLALVPLTGSICTSEVAGLAGILPGQLDLVVRMTATAGLLEPAKRGRVAHAQLSAAFVTDMSLLDATMFLAESAAPAALQMVAASQQDQGVGSGGESAYCISQGASQSFEASYLQQERLRRQWFAFHQCTVYQGDSLIETLGQLNWGSLEDRSIVDVSTPYH
jgi:hypothetical protein